MREVQSRHFFRRRARQRERDLTAAWANVGAVRQFKVVPAQRGPWRWLVVRTR